ncbi:MAG: sugar ABC transporter substrate-binding protein [Candidatus Krumholzibacteriota bacterium]|nr:sugar ABC transporter substrate-binding protein [Candidatus Krumholzibacteriota bacterium]
MPRWAAVALLCLLAAGLPGCGERRDEVVLSFWAMGREGEVVSELVPDFEREHPGIRVHVQQIPWSAAHEKLLTAHVGHATPDLAQLGNTWIAEFHALGALAPVPAGAEAFSPDATFPGIWDTNLIAGRAYGLPWYVDTRLLFYRRDLLARAGYAEMPGDWAAWRRALAAITASGAARYGILLPLNEWVVPAVLGLQAGSPLLREQDSRGDFSGAAFRQGFDFYLGLFRDELAPLAGSQEIANIYQEFARGTFAMIITGPWNLGEFRRRLPAELQDAWATAPLPGPAGPASGLSLAGGSSLVVFRESPRRAAAWQFIAYLLRPEVQRRFYRLTGDLPARRDAWAAPEFAADSTLRSFRIQLERVVSTPKIPEWEQIASRLQLRAEAAVRGALTADAALAALDADVDRILEKRRWLLARGLVPGGEEEAP